MKKIVKFAAAWTEPVVTTSYVVDIRNEGKTIETKNTIYQMAED